MHINRVGNRIVVTLGGQRCILTTRQAFEFVTCLLVAIDEAREFGKYLRGEVPEPDRHKRKS
ncbi:hypothetical protein [Streptomyces sp. NPDC005970]|uniref:hypothetical protein n=1 Tax=Streptomyces sp. NPDC005970 TaxID=3156723 RepID=UPI0033F4546B